MTNSKNCTDLSNISYEKRLDLLQFAQKSGIINNIDDVEKAMKKSELERMLKQHPYKISFSSGRWQTYIKDDTQKSGRKKLVKSTQEKLNIALYEYYREQDSQAQLESVTLKTLYPQWKEYKSYIQLLRIISVVSIMIGKSITKIPLLLIRKLRNWINSLLIIGRTNSYSNMA